MVWRQSGAAARMCAVTASFNIFFAAVTHAVVVRFSQDPDIVLDLVHLEEDLEESAAGESSHPIACVQREVWGMLYADDEELCLSRRKTLPR